MNAHVKTNMTTAMKKAHRWITDAMPTSDEAGVMVARAQRWLTTVMPNSSEIGSAPDRIFSGEDGKWYFWTRSEHRATRRLWPRAAVRHAR